MTTGDWVFLGAFGFVVVAVFLGMRKGRRQYVAAMTAVANEARAEGQAEAKAQMAATLAQTVTVVAGNGDRGLGHSTDASGGVLDWVRSGVPVPDLAPGSPVAALPAAVPWGPPVVAERREVIEIDREVRDHGGA